MNIIRSIFLYIDLMSRTISSCLDIQLYKKSLVEQMLNMGYGSLFIIGLTSMFMGGVVSLQTVYQLSSSSFGVLIPKTVIGGISLPSILIELGPVISCLLLSGKVGTRIASELGAMRISEQIDSIEAMGINSATYLVFPRLLSGLIIFPLLYIYSCFFGILGAVFSSILSEEITKDLFLRGALNAFYPQDVLVGILKMIVFGVIIITLSSYKGYYTQGGSQGIGYSATQSTVFSSVWILLMDLILTWILL